MNHLIFIVAIMQGTLFGFLYLSDSIPRFIGMVGSFIIAAVLCMLLEYKMGFKVPIKGKEKVKLTTMHVAHLFIFPFIILGGNAHIIALYAADSLSTLVYMPLAPFAEYSFWAQLILGLFLLDFIAWGSHFSSHKIPFLWFRVHYMHHEMKFASVNWLGFRIHFVDSFTISFIPYVCLLFLGISPEIVSALGMARNTFLLGSHTHGALSFGFLDYFFLTPANHIWHHDTVKRCNYSVGFTILPDIVFRTFFMPKNRSHPKELGIENHSAVTSSIKNTALLRSYARNESASKSINQQQ